MKRMRNSIKRRNEKSYDAIIRAYLEEIGTARALSVWLLYRYGEHDQLLELECLPSSFLCPLAFHRDYLATRFLSKYEGLETSFDKTARAIEAFAGFEATCGESNKRLMDFPHGVSTPVAEVIRLSRRKVEKVLGSLDCQRLDHVIELSGFGPGVTTTSKGRWLSAFQKLRVSQEATTRLMHVLDSSLTPADYPGAAAFAERQGTPGNHVICVPKNSKIDRTIAIEPGLNSFFQKGVGAYVRKRLRSVLGINLDDQSVNQDLAWAGASGWGFATLDLKGASDTISEECVRLLVPEDWYALLKALRSPFYLLDGVWYPYSKHSSMGNGYTFELETLVFSTVCIAACQVLGIEWSGSVYGDDIIAPEGAVPLIVETLNYLGFSLNHEKSFQSGPFRESCGADWWNDVEVTPFYLKKKSDNIQVQTFANWLRTKSPSWLVITSAWLACYEYVPNVFRFPIPEGCDGGFIVNEWEWDPCYARHKGIYPGGVYGYKLRVTRFKASTREIPPEDPAGISSSLYRLGKISPATDLRYDRREAARQAGKWYTANLIAFGWPLVKHI